jgi:hypothetical protein
VTFDHGLGDVDQFAAAALRVVLEHLEGPVLGDCVAGHEDAFGLFDLGSAPEGTLEVLVFGESAQRDLERVL